MATNGYKRYKENGSYLEYKGKRIGSWGRRSSKTVIASVFCEAIGFDNQIDCFDPKNGTRNDEVGMFNRHCERFLMFAQSACFL